MTVFFHDPTYPENEDNRPAFFERLTALAQEQIPSVSIEDVDAGPSASVPGWAISVGAIGWFIFSAPNTIAENLPFWKAGFGKIVELANQLKLDFSIDIHDAAAHAISESCRQFSWDEGEIEVVSCTRHWRNLNGVWSDFLFASEVSEPSDWMKKHEEACRQLECRYTFLLCKSYDCATIIIDRHGQCEFAKLL